MAETLYKLTRKNDTTRGGCQWGKGVEHTAPGNGALCTSAYIHAYRDPALALLVNPIHGDFDQPHLWLAEGDVERGDGLKVGCTRLKTLRRLRKPRLTKQRRVKFALLCAEAVLPTFEKYVPDDNPPRQAIEAVARWLENPTTKNRKDAADAAYAAYAAAHAAAHAAHAAAYAAAYAAHAAAYAAAYAAYAAADAARAASAASAAPINFAALAQKAMNKEE